MMVRPDGGRLHDKCFGDESRLDEVVRNRLCHTAAAVQGGQSRYVWWMNDEQVESCCMIMQTAEAQPQNPGDWVRGGRERPRR